MSRFINELHKLSPDSLPEIKPTEVSESDMKRIIELTQKKLNENQTKSSRRPVSAFKRIAYVFAAAVILMTSATAVYAYRDDIYTGVIETGEAIKKFFTREEELVDQKAVMLDAETVVEEITMTVEKAVRDGDQGYLYVTLKNNSSDFNGYLLSCDEMRLEILENRGDEEEYVEIYSRIMGAAGIYAGEALHPIREDETDTIEMILPLAVTEAGDYRLTFTNLFAATEEDVGTKYDENMYVTTYADEISVDFTIDSELQTLDEIVIEPKKEFAINDAVFTLEEISISPIEIKVYIADRVDQTVEIDGITTPAKGYLTLFWDVLEIPGKGNYSEWNKYWIEEFYPLSYEICIDFYDDVASIDEYESGCGSRYRKGAVYVEQTFKLNSPAYLTDIERIYLRNNGSPEDIIVIWTQDDLAE